MVAPAKPSIFQNFFALLIFAASVAVVSGLGGWITQTSVDTWYQALDRPGFTPPDWVFAPVWTAIYVLMAVAAWLVWRTVEPAYKRFAIGIFYVQLLLNLGWSFLFFGARLPGLAFLELLVLLGAVGVTTVTFMGINRLVAGLLFVPYLLWTAYAALLNAAIWWMN